MFSGPYCSQNRDVLDYDLEELDDMLNTITSDPTMPYEELERN